MKKGLFLATMCFLLCGLWIPTASVSAKGQEESEEFDNIVQESVKNLVIASTRTNINWTVKKNSRNTTLYFVMDSGSAIGIGMNLSKTGWAGIMGIDGSVRYVEGTSITHTFNITKKQSYLVFVQNNSNSSLTATGFYIK